MTKPEPFNGCLAPVTTMALVLLLIAALVVVLRPDPEPELNSDATWMPAFIISRSSVWPDSLGEREVQIGLRDDGVVVWRDLE